MGPQVYAVVTATGPDDSAGTGADGGRTVLERCLDGLAAAEVVDRAVVVVPADLVDTVTALVSRQQGIWGQMRVLPVAGGGDLTDVLSAGLAAVTADCGARPDGALPGAGGYPGQVAGRFRPSPGDRILVAVHDVTRCLTPPTLVAELVDTARQGAGSGESFGGVVPVLGVADTVKLVGTVSGGRFDGAEAVRSTPAPEGLRVAQTPQVFPLDVLVEAVRMDEARRELDSVHPTGRSHGPVATDASSLVELAGRTVLAVRGDPRAARVRTRN